MGALVESMSEETRSFQRTEPLQIQAGSLQIPNGSVLRRLVAILKGFSGFRLICDNERVCDTSNAPGRILGRPCEDARSWKCAEPR